MGIVRNDPVMNLDTRQPLTMLPPTQRITRSTVCRVLKRHGIKYNPGISKDEAIQLLYTNNISFAPVPPGRVTDLQGNPVDKPVQRPDFSADGFPKHIGKLKKLCKENGITFDRSAKREDLVKLLNQHLDSVA